MCYFCFVFRGVRRVFVLFSHSLLLASQSWLDSRVDVKCNLANTKFDFF